MTEANADLGRYLRDQGIKQAMDHADTVYDEWTEKAQRLITAYVLLHKDNFMCEDLIMYAESVNFPMPPNNKAWGGIIRWAKAKGLIQAAGIGKSTIAKHHRGYGTIWRVV